MESASYYDRSKEKYTEEESLQIKKAYEIDTLSIIELAKKHKRTPGCIAAKLKMMGIIGVASMARGYSTYKGSDLYKEICKAYETKTAEKKEKKEAGTLSVSGPATKATVLAELNALKEDVKEMKKDIKEILRYMTALYELESGE
jgi:hypothetical protein